MEHRPNHYTQTTFRARYFVNRLQDSHTYVVTVVSVQEDDLHVLPHLSL